MGFNKEQWLDAVMDQLSPGPGYGFPDRELLRAALGKLNKQELAALERTLHVLDKAIAEGS